MSRSRWFAAARMIIWTILILIGCSVWLVLHKDR